jgi:hypothetical protein
VVSTPFLEEACGNAPVRTYQTQLINVVAYDVPALTAADTLSLAVPPGIGGSPGYSMERWFRVGFAGFYTTVRNLKFWMDSAVPADWQLLCGVSPTYRQPVRTRSQIAVGPVPTSATSIGDGPYTPVAHSLWIVLQAMVTRETTGSLDLDFRFTYDED